MATILITGATGTVGSSLASSLESKGHRLVYLVRPKNNQNVEERLSNALNLRGIESRIIWEGDIVLSKCGVKESEIQRWKGKIDKLIHCASSISFDELQKKQTLAVNVGGTSNILNLAILLEIPEFHHISTAYVAGDADYFRETDLDIGQTCRNPYEWSKLEAEKLVRKKFSKRYSIYRLAIVVGDSLTGYTPQFTGYYRPFAFFWHLQNSLKKKTPDILRRYANEGIFFDGSNATFILPIQITCSPISTLNLIPRDWVAEVLSSLAEIPATGKVFHLVHPKPKRVRWIIDMTFDYLGINGYSYDRQNNDHPNRPLLSKIQRIFDHDVRAYLPYIIHEASFGTSNIRSILGDSYSLPPEVDEIFLKRLIEYAKSVNFGKKKRVKT